MKARDAAGPSANITAVSGNITLPAAPSNPWPRVGMFGASQSDILPGENVTLQWEAIDAGTVTIEPGLGRVAVSGSALVAPQKTTRYLLTAVGERGASTAWVDVRVAERNTFMPDLVVTGVTHISGLLYYTIRNIGSADAGQSETYIYDLSNMLRDTSWVESLRAGEQKTLPFTNYDWKDGKITVCADGKNEVAEASEDNNCYVPSFGFKYYYDFAQMLSRASWRGSEGRIRFGQYNTIVGYATVVNEVVAADGNAYRKVIQVVPPSSSFSWVEGLFGEWQDQWQAGGYMLPIEMPYNARFTATVGMPHAPGPGSGVTFLFGLQSEDGGVEWWPGVQVSRDGRLQEMNIDLSAYGGKKVMVLLRVESGADPITADSAALWIEPAIRQ